MRHHFAGFNKKSYPAHITALTKVDMFRILNEAGFSNIKFYFTSVGGVPGIPQLKWQSLSFGLLKGIRFSDNIICVAQK
jgi:hypothetical protein